MASNPVSRIFLFSKSSRRSRAVVFWLQIFTTTSIQFFLSDSASLTVGEGDSVDMCFPFSGPVASIILYAITFVVDSICTNKVGILYKKFGDSPLMRLCRNGRVQPHCEQSRNGLFESKNNFDERATMSAIHGEGEKEKEPKLDKASKASKASKPDEK